MFDMSTVKYTHTIIVGFGGVIGTLLRFFTSTLLMSKSTFPWDTLTVNLIGSFILALLLSMMIYKNVNYPVLIFFTTGILGSFTTFSAIIIDLILLSQMSFPSSFIYLLITIIGGLFFAFCGVIIGKEFS